MEDFLAAITKEVFRRRPVLAEIGQNYSRQILFDYIQTGWQLPQVKPDSLFLEIIKEQTKSLFGADIGEKVLAQLGQKPLISTISHMGIWGHPIFVNADLIYSLRFPADEFVISLATESVSLNNTSSWSGSVLHHDGVNLKRTSFFTDRQKTLPVFSAPAIVSKEIDAFENKAGGQMAELLSILNFTKAEDFSQQCCRASANLWGAVFPSAPKLLYLPLETIISKYLIKAFKDQTNIFSKIILTNDAQNLWKKYFINEHSFMFWEIDAKGRRQALEVLPEKNELIGLIKTRKIYPAGPLCFAVLLVAGLACVGGFNQTTWLTQTKEKFLELSLELGETALAEKITAVPTKNFAESSLAWLNIAGNYLTPTALDLLLTQKDYYPVYKKLSQSLTLGQSLNLAMADIYSVVVPKAEQIRGLDDIHSQALKTQLTELNALL